MSANSKTARSPLRVLDLGTGLAAAYCTKLMAGFGAEVVNIEPPSGDPMRALPPFARTGDKLSLPFVWYHTGKQSVALDLSDAAERERLMALVRTADVLVIQQACGTLDSLGLTEPALQALNPRLIVCAVTPFGEQGPYRDFQAEEITLYAMAGLMYATGDGARAPLNAGPVIASLSAGMKAYIACLMALYRRGRSGLGDRIEVSIQEAALDNFEIAVAEYLHLGRIARRNNDEHSLVPWRIFPCKDGHAAIMGGPIRNWLKAAVLFEEPKLLTKAYAHMEDRIRERDAMRALMQPWLSRTEKRHIMHEGQAKGLAWGYLASLAEVIDSPQTQARGFFEVLEQPGLGAASIAGAPYRPAKTPWRTAPAPALGAHTGDVFARWASTPGNGAAPQQQSAAPASQPLAGVRIVDLTHDWAGPHAARILADYGADVIKIEYPKRLDGMRGAYLDRIDQHPRWWEINRNKRSITLDLHLPEQVAAFKDLVRGADLVLENSRPGVMERFGLGDEVLRGLKPDLIMVSMSAYGSTGPESRYAGYGGAIEALSGVQSLTAYDRGGDRMRVREVDVTNGIMGACAAMTALVHHQSTGEGQWVDLSERETCTWLIGEHLLEHVVNGEQTLPLGNRHPQYVQGCYRCLGEDVWLVLTLRSAGEWRTFCRVAEHPEWAQETGDLAGLRARHDEIDSLIESWTRTQDVRHAMHSLQGAGLAAGHVMTARDLAADPHLALRGFIHTLADGSRYPGFPFRLAHGGGEFAMRGPDLGADNTAVLSGELKRPAAFLPDLSPPQLGTAFDLE